MGSLIIMMATGMPIASAFIIVDIIGIYLLWGGAGGLEQLISSIFVSVSTFVLLPLPLFVLMGEIMFHSGVAPLMIDAVDKWLGRLPGRLSMEAVAGGTILSTLTGASMGSVVILGSVLVPEMEKRGYKHEMSIGPILGSSGLAIMIPPSGLAVLLGAIGEINIGKILIAIIVPGLMLAVLLAIYIIVRCWLQPDLAPPYYVPPVPFLAKVKDTAKYILPLGFVVFMVMGVIIVGVATPTEAAATGVMGTYILAACYRRLGWNVIKKSSIAATKLTVMMFMILASSEAFAQILAYSGASKGLVEFALGLPLAPLIIMIMMQLIVLFLGCFLNAIPIMLLTLPIFMPVIDQLGFNPIWFGVIYLLNIQLGGMTPPFGMDVFAMKGVAPAGTTIGQIYKAAVPFVGLNLVLMALLMAFPILSLWLPSFMK